MIKVTIAAPDGRKTVIAEPTDTIKDLLNSNNIVFTKATLMLDGMILTAADINKTLGEMNVKADCTLSVTIKMDNAA